MTPQRRPALARWERQDGNQRDNKHHPLPHPSLVHQRPLPPLCHLQREEGPCLVHHQPLPLCCLKHEWGGSSRPPSATTAPPSPQTRGGASSRPPPAPPPLHCLKREWGGSFCPPSSSTTPPSLQKQAEGSCVSFSSTVTTITPSLAANASGGFVFC